MQPIHYCAQFGHLELFNLFCDYGVSPMSAKYVSSVITYVYTYVCRNFSFQFSIYVCTGVMYVCLTCIHTRATYVTGFAKRCLVRTQFQVSLFTAAKQIRMYNNRLTVHAYTIAKASTVCIY